MRNLFYFILFFEGKREVKVGSIKGDEMKLKKYDRDRAQGIYLYEMKRTNFERLNKKKKKGVR